MHGFEEGELALTRKSFLGLKQDELVVIMEIDRRDVLLPFRVTSLDGHADVWVDRNALMKLSRNSPSLPQLPPFIE